MRRYVKEESEIMHLRRIITPIYGAGMRMAEAFLNSVARLLCLVSCVRDSGTKIIVMLATVR